MGKLYEENMGIRFATNQAATSVLGSAQMSVHPGPHRSSIITAYAVFTDTQAFFKVVLRVHAPETSSGCTHVFRLLFTAQNQQEACSHSAAVLSPCLRARVFLLSLHHHHHQSIIHHHHHHHHQQWEELTSVEPDQKPLVDPW